VANPPGESEPGVGGRPRGSPVRAVLAKRKVYIFLSDNFAIVYHKSQVRVNDKVVFWESPLTRLPVPVPISKK
jgi:hypothetical protein